ncbi:MAG: gliding motility protein GldM [Flavobacteriaceae bacterium]|jgi:gliding motility-associated protein GldM|nr:gliding motility protein GldM [Flavobacteriaceae bacterium]
MAAGGSQTPRQKMINLMYLVFIAMMAMNVDREVLRSFEGVNKSLELSTNLTKENNITFYEQIEKKKDEGDEGYIDISRKAKIVKGQTEDVIKAIDAVKRALVLAAEYTETKGDEEINYSSLQKTDVVNRIFFVSDNKPTPEVKDMISKIQNYTKFMQTGVDGRTEKRIAKLFDLSGKGGKSWLVDQFYDQPLIAALTNLTKLESNIRTEEGNRVRDLLSNKLKDEIELKAFVPIVSAPKYVRVGEKFDVTIGFGAYDNTLKGSINLSGRSVPLDGGKAIVSVVASGVGKQTLSGSITYETPSGAQKTVPFSESYEVAQDITKELPVGGTVVADKMNVVYRGVDNPMSGSVTGVDASTISLRISSGSGNLSRSGRGWIYRPGAGTSTTFTISGTTNSGKTVSNAVTFRIKNIPKAQGQIRGTNVLSIPASSLPNQTVSAGIPDFEFPVSFSVTGFKVKVTGQPTTTVSGSSLRAAAGALAKARAGDQVLIFDISAVASGISQQNISPIVINVQ